MWGFVWIRMSGGGLIKHYFKNLGTYAWWERQQWFSTLFIYFGWVKIREGLWFLVFFFSFNLRYLHFTPPGLVLSLFLFLFLLLNLSIFLLALIYLLFANVFCLLRFAEKIGIWNKWVHCLFVSWYELVWYSFVLTIYFYTSFWRSEERRVG